MATVAWERLCPGQPCRNHHPASPSFRSFFSLFAQRFHVELLHGLNPVLVGFDGQRSHEPQASGRTRKDAYRQRAPLDLPHQALEHVGRLQILVMLSR